VGKKYTKKATPKNWTARLYRARVTLTCMVLVEEGEKKHTSPRGTALDLLCADLCVDLEAANLRPEVQVTDVTGGPIDFVPEAWRDEEPLSLDGRAKTCREILQKEGA
jgi:hypothetical protein